MQKSFNFFTATESSENDFRDGSIHIVCPMSLFNSVNLEDSNHSDISTIISFGIAIKLEHIMISNNVIMLYLHLVAVVLKEQSCNVCKHFNISSWYELEIFLLKNICYPLAVLHHLTL